MLGNLYGGGESPRDSTVDMTGGKRHSRRARGTRKSRAKTVHRRRRGGSPALAAAAIPLSLLGLQKFFQGRTGRADLKRASRGVRRTVRRGRRGLRRAL